MHQAMAEAPGLVGRVVAYLHHEVAGDVLAPYRSAGGPVYALAGELEQLRLETLVAGGDPWRFPTPVQTARLCGWNAFALQLLGDQMVDCDTEADPRTAGFVDPVLAEQAVVFYGQVPRWFSRARQAVTNPGYRLDVAVPVPLPDGPTRPPNGIYVDALIDSSARLCTHVTAALGDLVSFHECEGPRKREGVIREAMAEGDAACDYARGLRAGGDMAIVEVTAQVRVALSAYYLAGQLIAMPDLALGPMPSVSRAVRVGKPRLVPGPGERGFDPWCLTDPRAAAQLRGDAKARRAIRLLWDHDPDPTRTLAFKADVDGALIRGDIAFDAGHHSRCPFGPIFLVKRPVRIGGHRLHPLEQFTLDVHLAQDARSSHFVRQILKGPFLPAH